MDVMDIIIKYSRFIRAILQELDNVVKLCSPQSFNLIQDTLKFTIYGPLIQSLGNSSWTVLFSMEFW